ncbi:DUF1937 family protein [Rubellimicrobium aerolatum]|uniref:DUF1937 family protein n=1 Tax=Rubellimicrobium aerolatum TaxID=490979 RepID=A0ABW0SEP9_9RHOB|nr:DUF1937 family protein [Rubellimicrobium aerolatum]MBP1806934.1 hypothetical protein [Rubellimicrobium aerolatum]
MRRIFLACPYGHTDPAVVERRFEICNRVAAQIVRSGHIVFSQVSMSHPINGHLGDLDKAGVGALWAPVDRAFMEAMTEIVVIDEPGWRESAGVSREMGFFRERNQPVQLWSEVEHEFAT